jgi:small subunit ribosomal protein S15
MSFSKQQKQAVIQKMKQSAQDSGSPEVQVGILTGRITNLTDHFKSHAKDFHSRQGLLKMVSQRRKLLDYLKKHNRDSYQKVILELGIRK